MERSWNSRRGPEEYFVKKGSPGDTESGPAQPGYAETYLKPDGLLTDQTAQNLEGKKLVVLMLFAIPGTGTTGFSELFRSSIKQQYPNVDCRVQKSEDYKQVIFERLRAENPNLTESEISRLGQKEFVIEHLKKIETHIRVVGKKDNPLSLLILAKNYTFKNATKEARIIQQFVKGRIPTKIFGVFQQDGVASSPFEVRSGRYSNVYPFSGFFLLRCLKKISLRKHHVSFQTDEGVEFFKKFANAVGFLRNQSFSQASFVNAGLDGGIGYDFVSQKDQEHWSKNAGELKKMTVHLYGILQRQDFINEKDCWELKKKLEALTIDDEATTADEKFWKYQPTMVEKVRKVIDQFITTHYSGDLAELCKIPAGEFAPNHLQEEAEAEEAETKSSSSYNPSELSVGFSQTSENSSISLSEYLKAVDPTGAEPSPEQASTHMKKAAAPQEVDPTQQKAASEPKEAPEQKAAPVLRQQASGDFDEEEEAQIDAYARKFIEENWRLLNQ